MFHNKDGDNLCPLNFILLLSCGDTLFHMVFVLFTFLCKNAEFSSNASCPIHYKLWKTILNNISHLICYQRQFI
ncbi:hypothetical protein Lalb_Chr07g0194021 [Lupinus albus]|uniref:Uncharacterized protein n=1 Tax=Lupinus albus TaxID=3870 RepID=A0A6A4QB75_LUPAL|nr:hypothetical protein Lalb_Chr07g0194021 [Lupinus albus]